MHLLLVFCLLATATAVPILEVQSSAPDEHEHLDEAVALGPEIISVKNEINPDEHEHLDEGVALGPEISSDKSEINPNEHEHLVEAVPLGPEITPVKQISIESSQEIKETEALHKSEESKEAEKLHDEKDSKELEHSKDSKHSTESSESEELNKDDELNQLTQRPVLVQLEDAKKPSLLAWLESFFSRPFYSFRPLGPQLKEGTDEKQLYYAVKVDDDDEDW